MFTGIISDVGEIIELKRLGARRRMAIASSYDPSSIEVGASIANAGACLTAVGIDKRGAGSLLSFTSAPRPSRSRRLSDGGQGALSISSVR